MPVAKHGITANTPNNLILNAGTFYKNLVYSGGAWNGTILGATSGGGTISFTPEYFEPQIDGATVSVKNMIWKVGETASIKVTLTEVNPSLFTDALHLVASTADNVANVHTVWTTKSQIGPSDYLNNIAYVGTLSSGTTIIFILPNPICLGALEISPKDKENATYEVEFKGTATFAQEELNYIPYKIYYPQQPAAPLSAPPAPEEP